MSSSSSSTDPTSDETSEDEDFEFRIIVSDGHATPRIIYQFELTDALRLLTLSQRSAFV